MPDTMIYHMDIKIKDANADRVDKIYEVIVAAGAGERVIWGTDGASTAVTARCRELAPDMP